jgi:hypothetical protein
MVSDSLHSDLDMREEIRRMDRQLARNGQAIDEGQPRTRQGISSRAKHPHEGSGAAPAAGCDHRSVHAPNIPMRGQEMTGTNLDVSVSKPNIPMRGREVSARHCSDSHSSRAKHPDEGSGDLLCGQSSAGDATEQTRLNAITYLTECMQPLAPTMLGYVVAVGATKLMLSGQPMTWPIP